MPLDPSIPLSGRPVTPPSDPLTSIGQIMQFQNSASELALHNAQTQEFTAQAKQRQRDLGDANILQELEKDPATMKAFNDGDFSAAQGKIQPKSLQSLTEYFAKLHTDRLNLTKTQNDVASTSLGQLEDTVNGLKSLKKPDGTPDLDAINAALPEAMQRHTAMNSFQNAGISVPPLTQITDPAQLDAWLAKIGALKGATDKALATQKEQAATAASTAQAGEATAKAGQANVETGIKQKQLDAIKNLPPVGAPGRYTSVDSQVTDPDLQRGARGAYDGMIAAGELPAEAMKAVAPFAEKQATRNTEKNPAVLAARRDSAIAQAKALREGDNPALAGVPPAAAASAVNAATKLDNDYLKAREATEAMGKLLDLADSQNVAAGANIPMLGVGAANAINGIRRINSAEIAQYGTAGSLVQKIQGKLEGWTEGQPIPASVRDDIRALHQALGEQSYKQYVDGLNSLNQRTGAKFGPTAEAPNIRKAPGPQYQVGQQVKLHGQTITIKKINPDGTFEY